MMNYIIQIKRKLHAQYGFGPLIELGGGDCSIAKVPDGLYPMEIDGKIDHVKIINGYIHCHNFIEDPGHDIAQDGIKWPTGEEMEMFWINNGYGSTNIFEKTARWFRERVEKQL